jgi:uncharacterized protein
VSASLPDVNVLVALAWPSHVHHRLAADWFGSPAAEPWATCPITQSGFIRVSSNPGIVDPAVTPREARSVLRQFTALQQHQFWPDDLDFTQGDLPFEFVIGHRQVTDAYLLGLAIARDGRLVTLDSAIPDLLPPASPHRQRIVLLTG